MYHEALIYLFKQIPNMKSKPTIKDKTLQLIFTDIGCAQYMKKIERIYRHLENRS